MIPWAGATGAADFLSERLLASFVSWAEPPRAGAKWPARSKSSALRKEGRLRIISCERSPPRAGTGELEPDGVIDFNLERIIGGWITKMVESASTLAQSDDDRDLH